MKTYKHTELSFLTAEHCFYILIIKFVNITTNKYIDLQHVTASVFAPSSGLPLSCLPKIAGLSRTPEAFFQDPIVSPILHFSVVERIVQA